MGGMGSGTGIKLAGRILTAGDRVVGAGRNAALAVRRGGGVVRAGGKEMVVDRREVKSEPEDV